MKYTYGAVSLEGEQTETDERVTEYKLNIDLLTTPDQQPTDQL